MSLPRQDREPTPHRRDRQGAAVRSFYWPLCLQLFYSELTYLLSASN